MEVNPPLPETFRPYTREFFKSLSTDPAFGGFTPDYNGNPLRSQICSSIPLFRSGTNNNNNRKTGASFFQKFRFRDAGQRANRTAMVTRVSSESAYFTPDVISRPNLFVRPGTITELLII